MVSDRPISPLIRFFLFPFFTGVILGVEAKEGAYVGNIEDGMEKGARRRMITTENGAGDSNIWKARTTSPPHTPRPPTAPLLVSFPFYLSSLSPGIAPSFGRPQLAGRYLDG